MRIENKHFLESENYVRLRYGAVMLRNQFSKQRATAIPDSTARVVYDY